MTQNSISTSISTDNRHVYPPGPKGNILWGSALKFRENNLRFLLGVAKDYGDIVHFRVGPYHTYLFSHPDYAREILLDKADKFYKDRVTQYVLKPFLGSGMVVANGDLHKRQRKLVQPAFHHKRIETYVRVMTDYTSEMLDNWHTGQTYAIDQEMLALTLRVVSKALFNAETSEIVQQAEQAMAVINDLLRREIDIALPIPSWLPIEHNRRKREAIATLDKYIGQFMDEHRTSGLDNGDLLSMLMSSIDEDDGTQMSNKQVRDELVTMFMAGHETTAYTLTWVWYLLAQHPEIEAKLLDELNTVLGGRKPTMADIPLLKYTSMIIKEAMRIYAPAWLLTGREPIEDVEIGGYKIKKGSLVYISPYILHHDPRFFDDPETFRPERFVDEKAISRFAYIPFGTGPRVCIGQSLALTEAAVILATVIQRFHVALVPDQDVALKGMLTLRAAESIRVTIAEREPVQAVPVIS